MLAKGSWQAAGFAFRRRTCTPRSLLPAPQIYVVWAHEMPIALPLVRAPCQEAAAGLAPRGRAIQQSEGPAGRLAPFDHLVPLHMTLLPRRVPRKAGRPFNAQWLHFLGLPGNGARRLAISLFGAAGGHRVPTSRLDIDRGPWGDRMAPKPVHQAIAAHPQSQQRQGGYREQAADGATNGGSHDARQAWARR